MFSVILTVGFIALVIRWILKPEPSPIFGIYSQPGKFYYLKFAAFYLLFTLRKWQSKRARVDENLKAGYGMKSRVNIRDMESVQVLSDHPKAIDAVYFQGGNKDGVYFVAATARRPHHVINGFVFLKVPGEGLFTSPKLPDSTLFGTEDEFGAEGLKFEPLDPMRKWKISYKGQLRRNETDELVDVELEAIWSTNLKQFDFDTDMSSTAISRAFAREPWSREYFQMLQEAHQTHYEQMGRTNGTVKIDGKSYPFNIDSMRDHSYGHKREWKLLHRYGFHTMTLEDGTRINVGIVSQPCTSSVLELGYVYLADGRLFPVDECGFNIWDIGENGSPPKDYHFTFKAANRWWSVQVNVLDAPIFYIGWEWEAKIHERMCTFEVNGVPGWGISEFMYRNMDGRPEEYNERDPEWTRTINKG
ncbi:uncharacterized protein LOC116919103 [Daphnia magna]|nr:uncharacterized protein LOC116919103 [Daphnia magna]KAK4021997.1 hypothetical protein OUZ56_007484 [Daphnia magna]